MKYYGLDVHKSFIQVCELSKNGKERKGYKIDCCREKIEEFAKNIGSSAQVVLEATFHSWAIFTILRSYVQKVVVANPLQVREG